MKWNVLTSIVLLACLLFMGGCGGNPEATALREVPQSLKKMEKAVLQAIGSPYDNRKIKNKPRLQVSFLNQKIEKTNMIDTPFQATGWVIVSSTWLSDDGNKEWTYSFTGLYTLDTDHEGHPNFVSFREDRNTLETATVWAIDPHTPKKPDGSNELLKTSDEEEQQARLLLWPVKDETALLELLDRAASNWRKVQP